MLCGFCEKDLTRNLDLTPWRRLPSSIFNSPRTPVRPRDCRHIVVAKSRRPLIRSHNITMPQNAISSTATAFVPESIYGKLKDNINPVVLQDGYLRPDNNIKDELDYIINDPYTPTSTGSTTPVSGRSMRLVGFKYPDNSTVAFLPMSGIAVQYRNRVGSSTTVRGSTGSWTSVYGKDYVMLGASGNNVFTTIVSKVREAAAKQSISVGDSKIVSADGMEWVNVSCKPTTQCTLKDKGSVVSHELASVLMKFRSSLVVRCNLHVALSSEVGGNTATVKFTMAACHLRRLNKAPMGPRSEVQTASIEPMDGDVDVDFNSGTLASGPPVNSNIGTPSHGVVRNVFSSKGKKGGK